MHVGLDLLFLIPGETGGRETYARELIGAMSEVAPEMTLTAFVSREAGPAMTRELCGGLRVVTMPVSARRPDRWALGELVQLPVAARRAGVELVHSLANFAPIAGSSPRVVTVHDLQYRAVPELMTPARRAGTAVMLEGAIRRARRLIAVSAFGRDELVRELGIAASRIDVIPNGLGATGRSEATPQAELRARYRLDARPVLLSVATDLPHKNLGALLAALRRIDASARPVLLVAGAGTDGPRLAQRAVAEEVADDVRLLGSLSAADLEGAYRLATGAVLPSLYEGFGLPVLEAMSRGVPVACSDIPALREVAGDAAVLFDPKRIESIAGALRALIGDGSLRALLIDRGRARAGQFDWRRAARATLDTYRGALGAGAA